MIDRKQDGVALEELLNSFKPTWLGIVNDLHPHINDIEFAEKKVGLTNETPITYALLTKIWDGYDKKHSAFADFILLETARIVYDGLQEELLKKERDIDTEGVAEAQKYIETFITNLHLDWNLVYAARTFDKLGDDVKLGLYERIESERYKKDFAALVKGADGNKLVPTS